MKPHAFFDWLAIISAMLGVLAIGDLWLILGFLLLALGALIVAEGIEPSGGKEA
ncbi:MAG: hypothetical protein ABSG92_06335 [Conexivisphaerales archaeon]|jgi:hypothetical protein